jgi:uncharacterized membrane protein
VIVESRPLSLSLSLFRNVIPVMPLWCAVLLCVLNILIPGLGTIVSGFTVLCCANAGDSTMSDVRAVT